MKMIKTAIVLAAGLGTRLNQLTDGIPKCLVEINGRSILENALTNLEKNGIEETVIVVGYLKNEIINRVGSRFGQMKITYIENMAYDKTNNIYSLWRAKNYLQEPIILIEGDIFFEEQILKELLSVKYDACMVVGHFKEGLDGLVVSLDNDNFVTGMFFKEDQKDNFNYSDKYKTVNMYKFSKEFLERIMKYLDEFVAKGELHHFYEITIKKLLEEEELRLFAYVVNELKWYEIDDETDFKKAQLVFRS